ncbi:MAG: NAD-dependent epimerase/dehydratase family protein [Candidatus Korarchaeota archaeon]
MAKMRALVTGGAGFSGRYVVEELVKSGRYDVVVGDLSLTPQPVRDHIRNMGATFVEMDLTKPETLGKALNEIDTVFHVAAVFDYSAPVDLLVKVNVNGTENLIKESLNAGVKRMVVWSSLAAYGLPLQKIYKHPITEDQHPVTPGDPEIAKIKIPGNYDRSKRMQEEVVVRYIRDKGLRATIIRPAPIYGPGNKYGVWQIIYLVAKGVAGVLPRCLNKKYMPMIHVRDLARAAIYLSEREDTIGETYNVVDNSLTMFDTLLWIAYCTDHRPTITPIVPLWLVEHSGPFAKLLGKQVYMVAKLRKYKRPKIEMDTINYVYGNYWYSNAKLLATGFRYLYPDRKLGLLETINWYKENGWFTKEKWFD